MHKITLNGTIYNIKKAGSAIRFEFLEDGEEDSAKFYYTPKLTDTFKNFQQVTITVELIPHSEGGYMTELKELKHKEGGKTSGKSKQI